MDKDVEDTTQKKRGLDVTTMVKRLPLFLLYTIFANYFLTLLSVAVAGSFINMRGIDNVLPYYLLTFPFTFAILTWTITRQRTKDEF